MGQSPARGEHADRVDPVADPSPPLESAPPRPDAGETLEAVQRARPAHRDPEHVGPYRVLERIAEGGMGVVYKAEQKHPVRRLVALKVVKLGMDTKEVVARFEAERQALAMMNHPNVAKVYEAGVTEQGRPYFAMEYVAGVSLVRYCDESRLTTRERLELFIQVCHAVQHAHQKGIIHRDLKPGNVLVTHFDGRPVPKVIDFGIAKAVNHALTEQTLYTRTGTLIGTPEYMSPEQALTSGLDVDTRTDVYSLGVILYELLTGTLPFDPQTLKSAGPVEMAHIIKTVEPHKPSTRLSMLESDAAPASEGEGHVPGGTTTTTTTTGGTRLLEVASLRRSDPRSLRRELRGDLDWIVLKAMEKDRTRRYETANGLAMDVRRHLDHEPVSARPPTATYRLGKLARKHKGAFVAAGLLVLALLLGMAGTTAGLLHARRQRDQAVAARAEEVRQRAAADAARRQVKEANQFLHDLSKGFGNSTDFRRFVDAAAARLDQGWLDDEPEVKAAIHDMVGSAFTNLRAYPEAQRQLKLALEVGRRAYGEDRVGFGNILMDQGGWYLARDDYKSAESYYRQAVDVYRRAGRAGESLVSTATFNLAEAVHQGGDPAGAERLRREALMNGVSARTHDIADNPADAGLYYSRGNIHAALGAIREAQADYARAVELNPKEHWHWYLSACTRLYLGDEEGYRRDRRGMYEQFKDTTSPEIAERTAKVCALLPLSPGEFDLSPLMAAVDRSLSAGRGGVLPWLQMGKGFNAFRAGRYDEALEWLRKAKAISSANGQVTVDLLTAMAEHGAGRPREAEAALARAVDLADAQLAKPGVDRLDVGGLENWFICHILRREAERLIRGGATSQPAPVALHD